LDFVLPDSSKSRRVGTRSPISTNAPDCILLTRDDGTGGIDEPGVIAEVAVVLEVFLLVDGNTLTWSRCGEEEMKPRFNNRSKRLKYTRVCVS